MCEVFGEVSAVISSEAIDIIQKSGDVLLQLHEHIKSARQVHVAPGEACEYTIVGTLENVIAAKEELSNFLKVLQSCESPPELATVSCDNQVFTPAENFHSAERSIAVSSSCDGLENRPHISNVLLRRSRFYRPVTKRKSRRIRSLDPDSLSKNLEKMKLSCAENSSDADSRLCLDSAKQQRPKKMKDFESSVPYKFSCEVCSFKTRRSSHFQKHSAIHTKLSALFKCSRCNFTTISTSHLRRHEMSHSSTFQACSQCNYRTDDKKLLLRHVRLKHCKTHREKYSVVLNCPDCSYQTTLPRYFERHQRFHCNKQTDRIYQCDKCCYKTHRKEHFTRHVSNVHINERNYLCHLCGKAFKRADALQQHHQTHEENQDSTNFAFKCSTCDKSFRSHSHLSEHQAVHSEVRLFLCEICGASFKTRSVQRKHVATIHRNPRSYSCHTCNKRFNTLYAMKRHQKVHLNNKLMPMRLAEFEPTEVSSFTSDSAEEFKLAPRSTSSQSASNSNNRMLGGYSGATIGGTNATAVSDITSSSTSVEDAGVSAMEHVSTPELGLSDFNPTLPSQGMASEASTSVRETSHAASDVVVTCASIHPTPELVPPPAVLYFSSN